MQIGSVVWEEFLHIHTYIHTYIHTHGIGLSIRVTLNTKPASQVLTSQTKLSLTVTLTLTDTVMLTSRWEIIYAPKMEDYPKKIVDGFVPNCMGRFLGGKGRPSSCFITIRRGMCNGRSNSIQMARYIS